MYQILDNLYQGAMPKEKLPAEIKAVVNLMHSSDNKKCQVDDDLAVYVHLPILDGPCPGMDWLKMAVAVVESMMEKHTVYIHCRAGISRSSMLTAAVVMKKNGWRDHHKTLNFIAGKNPHIDPAPNFVKLLKEFERQF